MNEARQRILAVAPGVPEPEIGLFLAQMDDQNRRLLEDLAGATPDELAWQSHPGTNTIGMLLAHIAIVEAFWMSHAAQVPFDCQALLGLGEDDDGIPLPEDSRPPAGLAGKDLAFYADLLAKARRYSYGLAKQWTRADLDRCFQRVRQVGPSDLEKTAEVWTFNVRWVLYHVLEHLAGHYGQVNLLRHLYRVSRNPAGAGAVSKLAP